MLPVDNLSTFLLPTNKLDIDPREIDTREALTILSSQCLGLIETHGDSEAIQSALNRDFGIEIGSLCNRRLGDSPPLT